MSYKSKLSAPSTAVLLISALTFANPLPVKSQALEEIIVTAQRREQSLQDVPLSLEVISGDEITAQGFVNLHHLSTYSPSLQISPSGLQQAVRIRGVGTSGANFGFEQAVPTFVDGIHNGRASQVLNSFMDVAQVEVVRGAQPVFAGQNATAGAINITTRKPGQVWEGNVIGEVGNDGIKNLELAVGGPVSDTFGVRFAGKYDYREGYMIDIFSRSKYPKNEGFVGRGILQWRPVASFEATFKYEYMDLYDEGQRGTHVHLSGVGNLESNTGQGLMARGIPGANLLPLSNDWDNLGRKFGPTFLKPPLEITQAASVSRATGPVLDLTQLALAVERGDVKFAGTDATFQEQNIAKPWNSMLNLSYQLANEVELSWITGFSRVDRIHVEDFGSGGPFPLNPLLREETLDQWSSELRITSPIGSKIDWMMGVYWQDNNMVTSSNSWRSDTRQQVRRADNKEDARWLSAFATATFNFLDDKASLDLGGRVTDVKKTGFVSLAGAQWLVGDVEIIRAGTCPPALVVCHGAVVTGITEFSTPIQAYGSDYSTSEFDPQVVIRWRPADSMSLYAKWAEAFKAGGFDTGTTTLTDADAFVFDTEQVTNWELGSKNTFWDGRMSLDAVLFWSVFDNLQVSSYDIIKEAQITANAGKVRVRGLELLSRTAVNEQLTVNLSAVFLDSRMLAFPGDNCSNQDDLAGRCTGPGRSVDRTGERNTNSPKWNFTVGMNYWQPVMSEFKVTFNGALTARDKTHSFGGSIFKNGPQANMNLTLGFGSQDDTWHVSLWGRHLLEPRSEYIPENDFVRNGLVSTALNSTDFRSYGLQFRYRY